MTRPIIEMAGVRKTYAGGVLATEALSDFSLRVEAGELLAVMGPSGSGKTTFLNVAGLLDDFDAGSYLLDGADVSGLSERARAALRNEKLGFVFQAFNLIPDLDVEDNVAVPLRYRRLTARERARMVGEALEKLGLTARRRALPAELSGGQQQRAAIARALVGKPS